MATHSSVLARRIPGTWEPGGLPSMGSHIVGHDWSDLAAAAMVSRQDSALQRAQGYQGCRHQEKFQNFWYYTPVHCPKQNIFPVKKQTKPYTFLGPCSILLGPDCASGVKVTDEMALPVQVHLGSSSSAIALQCVSQRAAYSTECYHYLKTQAEEERSIAAEKKKKQDEQRLIERELAEEAQEDSVLKWACLSPEQYDE